MRATAIVLVCVILGATVTAVTMIVRTALRRGRRRD